LKTTAEITELVFSWTPEVVGCRYPRLFLYKGLIMELNFEGQLTKCLEKLIQQYPKDAKIKDYEEDLCLEDQSGLCCDGAGKLMFDSNIGDNYYVQAPIV
jgi:hypothetical protein